MKERAEVVHLDTIGLAGSAPVVVQLVNNMPAIPHDGLWDEMLSEAVHMMKVNQFFANFEVGGIR